LKVLLTGANGFVGSRILRRLRASGINVAILVRPTSDLGLLRDVLEGVELRHGSLDGGTGVASAVEGVTHVIHCAGKTKALHAREFEAVNVEGTRHLLKAVQSHPDQVQRLVLISSLAASGPSRDGIPVRETDPPRPVSAYGRSKLAGEAEVRQDCPVPWVILRPGGVYGPGDRDFLQLFQSVQRGLCPQFGGGIQRLNLLYVEDLAEVAVKCLTHDLALGRTAHVAHASEVTAGELAQVVARVLGARARTLSLPRWTLVPISWVGELSAHLTGRPGILSVDRRHELMATGWTCDTTVLRRDLGLDCPTSLEEGLRQTAEWYRATGWLR